MEVDPERLRSIAGKVGESAVIIDKAYSSRSSAFAPPSGQATGWAAASAARSVSSAWGSFVDRLGGAVSGLGTDLTAAADEYAAADQRAADRQRGNRFRFE